MAPSIEDQLIDFYDTLFDAIFSEPFRSQIKDSRRRRAVLRQVAESADAASQSLTRFFLNRRLSKRQAADILNGLAIDVEQLVHEHDDDRWQEVIALYCGLAPTPAARGVVERLIAQTDTPKLSTVLADAYLSAGPELLQDRKLRQEVLERVAIAPARNWPSVLERFPTHKITSIANRLVGKIQSEQHLSEAHHWLHRHPKQLNSEYLVEQLQAWREMLPTQITELIHLIHAHSPDDLLAKIAIDADIYAAAGPKFSLDREYNSQAKVALIGLAQRNFEELSSRAGVDAVILQILRTLSVSEDINSAWTVNFRFRRVLEKGSQLLLPQDPTTWPEFASLARRLAERLAKSEKSLSSTLNAWADSLEQASAVENIPPQIKNQAR